MFYSVVGLAWLVPALAYVVNPMATSQQVLSELQHGRERLSLHMWLPSTLEYYETHFDETSQRHRPLCVLHPKGEGLLDDEPFKTAVARCGNGGVIRLPDHN